MKSGELLLTPAEAAERLRIGRSKLYEFIGAGLIETVKIGRCRRVSVAALEQFVENLRRDQTEPGADTTRNTRR